MSSSHNTQDPPSRLTLRRSPLLRRRQRLTVDAGPTDKHRRPRMAFPVAAGTPSSGQAHCLEMGTPLRTCSLSAVGDPASPSNGRPCAAAAIIGVSCFIHITLTAQRHCKKDCHIVVLLILQQAGWTPRGRQAAQWRSRPQALLELQVSPGSRGKVDRS